MKPLKRKILVEYLENKNDFNTTNSGLIYKDTQIVKVMFKGKVLEVGDKVRYVKKGDVIMFLLYKGIDIEIKGKKSVIIHENRALLKII